MTEQFTPPDPVTQGASLGRRVVARLLEGLLVLLVYAVWIFLVLQMTSTAMTLAMVWIFAWAITSIVVGFLKAGALGQLALGMHHVDQVTGRRSGVKFFLKYLLQAVTFVAPIISLISYRDGQTWYDRTVGVVLVDSKVPTPATGGGVRPPAQGWSDDESHLTQLRTDLPTGTPGLGSAPSDGFPMIQSVPSSVPITPPPVHMPPSEPPRNIEVIEPGARHAAPQEYAESSPKAVAALLLDSGERVSLTGTIIVGRAPVQRSGLGHAELVTINDPSVSANHLAIGADAAGAWVMDLRSTNGSTIVVPGSPPLRLEPTTRQRIPGDCQIGIGNRTLRVVTA